MMPPLRLKDIAGNERLIELLRKGCVPPAALFAGPEGVGKKTTALLLATLANCRNPVSRDLCGHCGSCFKTAAGNHPDVLLFQSEGLTIGIDEMRRLSRETQYRPFEGRRRYFVVDQAEKLSDEAANSVLKTLEEPPETSRIILVTAYPQRLLPTIRSRCQTFVFLPLSRDQIVTFLREKTDLEEIELRASFAEGSLGKALSLDIDLTLKRRDRMLELLGDWLKSKEFQVVFQRCEARPLNLELKKRESVRHYLELLEILCYDLYFFAVGTPLRIVNRDREKELRKMGPTVSLEQIRDLLYHIGEARRDVDRNVQPLICFETLWLS